MLAVTTNVKGLAGRIKTVTCALALLAALVVLPLYAYKVYQKNTYSDFDVYYRTSHRINHQLWEQIYNIELDQASPFRYSPLSWPFFVYFYEMRLEVARTLWYGLNYLFYFIGFFFLFRSLYKFKRETFWITAFSFLFVLRFCLDSFMIGQVSGIMFMCLAITLEAWLNRKANVFGAALTIPAILKLGPGVIAGLFLNANQKFAKSAFRYSFYTIIFLATLSLFLYEISLTKYLNLFTSWFKIVVADSSYFDASHYGSQSFKSVLLRFAKNDWISIPTANALWKIATVVIVGTLSFFWALRAPRTLRTKGLFFCLGVFVYLICMPETFKYAMTLLAFPVALLLTGPLRKNEIASLVFGFFTLSLAGYDVIGPTLFFPLQKASIPFFAIAWLAVSTIKVAWRESKPSQVWRSLQDVFSIPHALQSSTKVQSVRDSKDLSFILPIPLSSTTQATFNLVQYSLKQVQSIMQKLEGRSYEIIFTPFGNHASESHPLIQRAILKLPFELQNSVVVTPAQSTQLWRGAALQEAYAQSLGKCLFVLNVEQPCSSSFFFNAFQKILEEDFDIVRADRRHPQSEWTIAIPLIHRLNQRFKLSLRFNQFARKVLPLPAYDLHSFNFVMKRSIADIVFTRQTCKGLLFDIEMSLLAKTHRFNETHLPAHFLLEKEKKLARLNLELIRFIMRLPLIFWRFSRGYFEPLFVHPQFTADDWGLSPAINQGILELAHAGIVKRVSMLAKSKFLDVGLRELQQIQGLEIGLHFELTHSFDQSPFWVLARWMLSNKKKKTKLRELVRREFLVQLQTLNQHGVFPQYMDGHHHIHMIPGILPTIASLIADAQIKQIRLPYEPKLWFTKKFPLNILALLARGTFKKYGFHTLNFYYPQSREINDINYLIHQINSRQHFEIICHPAISDDSDPVTYMDSYTHERVTEYQTLRNLAFLLKMKKQPLRLETKPRETSDSPSL